MGSKKKHKHREKQKRTTSQQGKNDLSKILMNKQVSFRVRDYFTETYVSYDGVFRGIYRLDGHRMVAIDSYDEKKPTTLRRHYFYLHDISDIEWNGSSS